MMQGPAATATKLMKLFAETAGEGGQEMYQEALSAAVRWTGPRTTEPELRAFIQRQVTLLDGAEDRLSTTVREGWEELARALGMPARPGTVASLA